MLTVITGPMFSGKSREILNIVERYKYAKKKVILFAPEIDKRKKGKIYSRTGLEVPCNIIKNSKEILDIVKDENLIVIDEAQFLDDEILDVVIKLILDSKEVLIGGLDKKTNLKPFGPMPQLLALADKVIKLTSICPICGKEATNSIRIVNGKRDLSDEIKIDYQNENKGYKYEPRCYNCLDKI